MARPEVVSWLRDGYWRWVTLEALRWTVVEDTWSTIDLPVLRAAVKYLEDHDYQMRPQAFDLAPELGLEPMQVGKALMRLDGAFIEGEPAFEGLTGYGVKKIYPEARRAVGQWPTPESLAMQLLASLASAAESEPDPERRSKLKQTAMFLGSGGKDLLINLLASVIAKGAGMS